MTSTQPPWNGWPPTSQPEHSAKEIEHRLTTLDINQKHQGDRLNLHERVILGIMWALYIIAQDKLPIIAKLLWGER